MLYEGNPGPILVIPARKDISLYTLESGSNVYNTHLISQSNFKDCDCAIFQVAAVLDSDVKNPCLIGWGQHSTWNDVLAIMRRLCPVESSLMKFLASKSTS